MADLLSIQRWPLCHQLALCKPRPREQGRFRVIALRVGWRQEKIQRCIYSLISLQRLVMSDWKKHTPVNWSEYIVRHWRDKGLKFQPCVVGKSYL